MTKRSVAFWIALAALVPMALVFVAVAVGFVSGYVSQRRAQPAQTTTVRYINCTGPNPPPECARLNAAPSSSGKKP